MGVPRDWQAESKIRGTDFTAEEAGSHLEFNKRGNMMSKPSTLFPFFSISEFAMQCEMKVRRSSFEGVIFR